MRFHLLLPFLSPLPFTTALRVVTEALDTAAETWYENLALGPNGNILSPSLLPNAVLYLTDITSGNTTVVHEFAHRFGCLGVFLELEFEIPGS